MFGQSSCIEIITTKFLKKLKNVLFHDVFGQVWMSLDKGQERLKMDPPEL